MATDNRLELQYATFVAKARLDAQSSATDVVVRSEGTRLYCGTILGVLHLIIEAPGLAHPGTIPWSNVASVGWLETPAVDFVLAPAKPEPAKKAAKP